MLGTPRTPRKKRQKNAAPVASKSPTGEPTAQAVDTTFLETLLGYNTRRASLSIIGVFLQRMRRYDLRPVDFSVLTVIAHNPGVTSRQICTALDILPPNLAILLKGLDRRGLVERRPHPIDGRSMGLHLSAQGKRLQRNAQAAATKMEQELVSPLTPEEQELLKRLLRRFYKR